jgi:hypothetical protein
MRSLLFGLLLLAITGIIKSQDTIFLKTGEIIPAIIVEKGEVELKYKKFAQPEPAGIYTVFNSDVASIHYKNGSVAALSTTNQNVGNTVNNQSTHFDPVAPVMKFNIGVTGTYFKRNESDNLILFWRHLNGGDPSLDMNGNPRYFALNLGMSGALGGTKRNWFGMNFQLNFTPSDAISASKIYNGLLNEIKLNTFIMSIIMFYGHTIDHKKNLILIFEPGIDIGMMSGTINIDTSSYKVSSTSAFSYHLAAGLDWNISKKIMASLRVGQRFMQIKEAHESGLSKYGYSSFYVDYPTNQDHIKVNWSGSYVSFGISYSLYGKMNPGRRR